MDGRRILQLKKPFKGSRLSCLEERRIKKYFPYEAKSMILTYLAYLIACAKFQWSCGKIQCVYIKERQKYTLRILVPPSAP